MQMWDLLVGPMPAAMPLCCCCAAKAGLVSDICRMSLMMFCLSMGLGSETGRSSQNSCGWAFCRSFRMSSSSEDWKEQRGENKEIVKTKKQIKILGLYLENKCCFTCTHTKLHVSGIQMRCEQIKPIKNTTLELEVFIWEMGMVVWPCLWYSSNLWIKWATFYQI